MKALAKIILLALVLRIVVSFLGYHGDVNDFYWWTRDLIQKGIPWFYDRYIANATQPIYPPVTSYLFYISGILHEISLSLLWFLNIHIRIFPSNLIFWMESPAGWYIFNKIPAILCDLGITYVLYLFAADLKDKKAGMTAALLFAFVPVFWYNSALWGQTESVFALPMITAFYMLYKNNVKSSMVLYTLALLTKPTALFPFPVFVYWLLKKGVCKQILIGLLYSIFVVLVLYFPFHPENLISWIISFYSRSLNGVLGYTVANAFNLWALVFGFDNRPDSSLFLGIPANIFGYIIFTLIIVSIAFLLFRKKEKTNLILLAAAIVSFSAFLFLTRMHERYFYPSLVFMIPLAAFDKRVRRLFWISSSVHLVNLYHFWWMPKVYFLIALLSSHFVEKTIILLNIFTFLYLIYIFGKDYAKAT